MICVVFLRHHSATAIFQIDLQGFFPWYFINQLKSIEIPFLRAEDEKVTVPPIRLFPLMSSSRIEILCSFPADSILCVASCLPDVSSSCRLVALNESLTEKSVPDLNGLLKEFLAGIVLR